MYLTKINKKTGLVFIEDEEDGVLSIKEFKDVISDNNLSLECFTAIALTADYKSPIRYYGDEDRALKAMEEVTGDRRKWVWKQEKIQLALKKYDELQYNPVIEEGNIHYQRKINKLKEYKKAELLFGKRDKDGELIDPSIKEPSIIAKELRSINNDIKEYENQIQGTDIFAESPVKNGYKLSRLEQKIDKKNSFYNQIR